MSIPHSSCRSHTRRSRDASPIEVSPTLRDTLAVTRVPHRHQLNSNSCQIPCEVRVRLYPPGSDHRCRLADHGLRYIGSSILNLCAAASADQYASFPDASPTRLRHGDEPRRLATRASWHSREKGSCTQLPTVMYESPTGLTVIPQLILLSRCRCTNS